MKPTIYRTIAATFFIFVLILGCLPTSLRAASATWELNPGSGDWNTATNWNPVTVPNGSMDTATFDLSNTTAVSISANTEVEGIVFNANASAFTITSNPGFTLTLSGTGVTNNSANTQNFVTAVDGAGGFGQIHFTNSATAGSGTMYTNNGALIMAVPGITNFYNTSSAGSATFVNNGGTADGAGGGATQFLDSATAANGTFINNGGTADGAHGGLTNFVDDNTAANGTFTSNAGTVSGAEGGRTVLQGTTTAANGTFTNNGASIAGAVGGSTEFLDTSNGGNSTVTSNGGTAVGAAGGLTLFSGNAANIFQSSNAGNATLIANGGTGGGDGGRIEFIFFADGGTSRVELFGNGNLDISFDFASTVTIGSLEGDGQVFLGSGNLAIGSNDLNTTFSGLIQDGGLDGGTGGSITKVGAGTLTLTSDNTYTGGTTIESGVLAIGSLNAMGTGDVTVNGGTLRTANGPRTFNVGGNYVQNSGGILQLQIGGLNSGVESDLLNANGSASLSGNVTLVRVNNFDPAPGDRVTIINDAGGHTGMFDSVTSTFVGLLQPVPHYDEALDVYIRFEITSFLAVGGLTPNQEAVANELDEVRNDPRAMDLIDFLVTEPFANLPHDYDLIAPEELASIYEIGFSHATVQSANLQRRMDDIRAGSTGFSAAGYQMSDTHGFTKGADGKTTLEKNPAPALVPSPENRWGVFITGTGQFVDVESDFNAQGYDITTAGFTLGVDYRVTSNFAIGLSAGYAHSDSDLVDDVGHIDADGGKIGFYTTYFSGGFYLDGAVNGGLNTYDTHRGALLGTAEGDTDGAELNAFIGAGYDWTWHGIRFGPVATFQFSSIWLNSFTESGSLAPLHYPDQDEDSVRSSLGLRFSHDCKFGSMILRPEVRAAWQHEYNDRAYPIDAQFASGAGSIFTVHGPKIGRDSALVGAGAALLWSERVSTYVYYDGQLGRNRYDSHSVSGGLRISF